MIKKVLNLTYKVIEAPKQDKISVETFMKEYIVQLLSEAILNIQLHDVYWRKFNLRTPTSSFSYLLPDMIRSKIVKPPKVATSYQFAIQMGQNNTVMLQIYGVPGSYLPDDILMCEQILLHPINIDCGDSRLQIFLCGINTVAAILNVIGRGLRTITPRKVKTKTSKKKITAKAR